MKKLLIIFVFFCLKDCSVKSVDAFSNLGHFVAPAVFVASTAVGGWYAGNFFVKNLSSMRRVFVAVADPASIISYNQDVKKKLRCMLVGLAFACGVGNFLSASPSVLCAGFAVAGLAGYTGFREGRLEVDNMIQSAKIRRVALGEAYFQDEQNGSVQFRVARHPSKRPFHVSTLYYKAKSLDDLAEKLMRCVGAES